MGEKMKKRYMKRKIIKHLEEDIKEYKEGIREDKKLLKKLRGTRYKRGSCSRKRKMSNYKGILDKFY